MKKPLRLLIIEDVEDHALLLVRELSKAGFEPDFLRVEAPQELEAALDTGRWDAIISDYNLPGFNGLDALRTVQAKGLDLPFILISGVIGEEQAVESLKAGAHDFILKANLARLGPALERELREAAIRHERRQTAEELTLHREHLEELVQQRTEDLAAANEELQAQGEELQAQSEELINSMEELQRIEQELRASEEQLRLMVEGVKDYAIFMLDPQGLVLNWNKGAESIKGYLAEEIIGRHVSCFYIREDLERGAPENALKKAATEGRYEEEGWRVRRDGSRFWASVLITALHDDKGNLQGFTKVTRDNTERKLADQAIERLNTDLAARAAELEVANLELEAFNRTVAHDLRQPLTVISGYCQAIEAVCGDQLTEECTGYLREAHNGALRMNSIIDALLYFSRMGHAEPRLERVELSALAHKVATELKQTEPGRQVDFRIADGIAANADAVLLRAVLDNLLGNAWKYSGKQKEAVIEFGRAEFGGKPVYFVRDNGAGFDKTDADKLFIPFERLPGAEEFQGFGIGLATVERIIKRHGGKIWAEGEPGKGATFYFTLP